MNNVEPEEAVVRLRSYLARLEQIEEAGKTQFVPGGGAIAVEPVGDVSRPEDDADRVRDDPAEVPPRESDTSRTSQQLAGRADWDRVEGLDAVRRARILRSGQPGRLHPPERVGRELAVRLRQSLGA